MRKVILIILLIGIQHSFACKCKQPNFKTIDDVTIKELSDLSRENSDVIFLANLINTDLLKKTYTLEIKEIYKGTLNTKTVKGVITSSCSALIKKKGVWIVYARLLDSGNIDISSCSATRNKNDLLHHYIYPSTNKNNTKTKSRLQNIAKRDWENELRHLKQNVNKKTDKVLDNDENKVNNTFIKEYAQNILNGTIQPTSDDTTFTCINSIFTKNENDLNYFFKVFRLIVKKTAGNSDMYIEYTIIEFLEFNPIFFIDKYSEFDVNEKDTFISHIAYIFSNVESSKSNIDTYFININDALRSNKQRELLASIKEKVIKKLK